MTLFRLLLITMVFMQVAPASRADAGWVHATTTDGITLFTRSGTNSPIKEVKAVMTVETTLAAVANLIMDAGASSEWIFGIKASEVLKSDDEQDVWVRHLIGLPWPLDDRDAINEMQMQRTADGSQVVIELINRPEAVPPYDGVVRMAVAGGQWTLSDTGDGRVEVAQVYRADPGGQLPEWVINMFILDGPIATFKAMRELLQSQAYQSADPQAADS